MQELAPGVFSDEARRKGVLSPRQLSELGAFKAAYEELAQMEKNAEVEHLVIVFIQAAQIYKGWVGLSESYILALFPPPFDRFTRTLVLMVKQRILDHETHKGESVFFPTERLVGLLVLEDKQPPPQESAP